MDRGHALIKRRDYQAMRRARTQSRAFKLFQKASQTPAGELPEESPECQALMRVWQRFTEDIVREFTPLVREAAEKATS